MRSDQEEFFIRRMRELARNADVRQKRQFTGFLDLMEQTLLRQLRGTLPVPFYCWGGYPQAERVMVCFSAEEPEKSDYPMELCRIAPKAPRFAEELSHRDYLGAILHLGLDRQKIGDLAMTEGSVLVFCCQGMAAFLQDHLERIRHTLVTAQQLPLREVSYSPSYTKIKGTVSSLRLDAILSLACHNSRGKPDALLSSGMVFVNGGQCLKPSQNLAEGDIFSVRGIGKFQFQEVTGKTKKDRIGVTILKYV